MFIGLCCEVFLETSEHTYESMICGLFLRDARGNVMPSFSLKILVVLLNPNNEVFFTWFKADVFCSRLKSTFYSEISWSVFGIV